MRKETSTNSLNKANLEEQCPMQFAMQRITGRWKILILWYVGAGINRFGKLKQILPGITTKMLSQQLRELEKDQLLSRTIFAEMPPRVEYKLSAEAKSLIPVLKELYHWGKKQKKKALLVEI